MYPVNEGRGARWVTDRKTIANNYLRGWFTLDVVSIGVSAFDYLHLARPSAALASPARSGTSRSCVRSVHCG